MYISRTLWFLAAILALSHATSFADNIFNGIKKNVNRVRNLDGDAKKAVEDAAGAVYDKALEGLEAEEEFEEEAPGEAEDEFKKVLEKADYLFSKEATEVENKIVETAKKVKKFYDNHKKLITAIEIIALAGTGLGEAGILADITEMVASGAWRAVIRGAAEAAVEMIPSDLEELEALGDGISELINSVKSIGMPSYATVKAGGEAAVDLLYARGKQFIATKLRPLLKKIAIAYAIEKAPLVGAQIVISLANLIGTSGPHINTPEVACKMENILIEQRKRTVDARLEKISRPRWDHDFKFLKAKRKTQYKPYNKKGYRKSTDRWGCKYNSKGDACFMDEFKRNKGYATVCPKSESGNCYEDYLSMTRREIEATFPVELFTKTCKRSKTTSLDQIDENSYGNWTIQLKRFMLLSQSSLYPTVEVFIDGQKRGEKMYAQDVSGLMSVYKSFLTVGPFKKKEPYIEIKVKKRFDSGYRNDLTIEGNIYDLWKNGYTPKDPNNYLDVSFSWRGWDQP